MLAVLVAPCQKSTWNPTSVEMTPSGQLFLAGAILVGCLTKAGGMLLAQGLSALQQQQLHLQQQQDWS